MRMIQIGRGLLALASAGVAVVTVTCGNFALLGKSLPAGLPGREAWVYGFALAVLVASAGLCFTRTARVSALIIGVYYAAWAVTSTPPIYANPLSIGAWYGFCEALTSLTGAWILYVLLRRPPGTPVRVAEVLFGLTCIFYGVSHFVYASYTASMVPAWLPGQLQLAYFTGLGHIAGGVGIVAGILPRLAAFLEATMMSLFGLLVWVPSFFMQPRPAWATQPQSQWSELALTVLLAAAAWIVAAAIRGSSTGRRSSRSIP